MKQESLERIEKTIEYLESIKRSEIIPYGSISLELIIQDKEVVEIRKNTAERIK